MGTSTSTKGCDYVQQRRHSQGVTTESQEWRKKVECRHSLSERFKLQRRRGRDSTVANLSDPGRAYESAERDAARSRYR